MLQLRILLTTVLLVVMFALFQEVAKREPVQPQLKRFSTMACGLLLLSLFPQIIWWIWSLL